MRRLLIVLAALGLVALSSPAQASDYGSGAFTYAEYQAVFYKEYKGTVQNVDCNCTGTFQYKTFTPPIEDLYYYDSTVSGGGVFVAYYENSTGSQLAYRVGWCGSHNGSGLTNCQVRDLGSPG